MLTVYSFLKDLRRMGRRFGVSPDPFFKAARKLARDVYGVNPNPLGADNIKVGGPSTYRPVGATCPACPYINVCYAGAGHAGLSSKRASHEALPSLFSFAIALAYSERFDIPVRLHTTGGFAQPGQTLDIEYLEGLIMLAEKSRHKSSPWAWSYTHFSPRDFEPWRRLLKEQGVSVMYSDLPAPNGAVIWDFDDMRTLNAMFPTVTFIQCMYQVNKTPCVNCRLCMDADDKSVAIVFKPHSSKSKDVAAKSKLILESGGVAVLPPTASLFL